MKKWLHVISFLSIAMLSACDSHVGANTANLSTQTNNSEGKSLCDNQAVLNAFDEQQSHVQVSGCGEVVKILPDDNEGNRHQKFIIKLDSQENTGHTILVAHNIDLAPYITNLAVGQTVNFYGEYIYNPQGGVIHWTHKDPAARHQDGWIEVNQQRYW